MCDGRKYLLLRKNGEGTASNLYEIKGKGLKVFSNEYLAKLAYPMSARPKPYYLCIEIEKVSDVEFKDVHFDFKALKSYIEIQKTEKNIYAKVGFPFTVTLTELMNGKIKIDEQH